MSDTKTTNPVVGALWTSRNPMQKTANLGVAAGLVLGAAGASTVAVTLTPIILGVYYGKTTEFKKFKRTGMAFVAGFMTLFTVTVGGIIGSSVTGKEWLADSGSTSTSSAPATTPAPEPAAAPTPPPVVVPEKWDSAAKKAELEESIKAGMKSTFTGAEQASVQSVSCTATATKAFWHCDIRKLGETEPTLYKIEVSEDGGWAGQPI